MVVEDTLYVTVTVANRVLKNRTSPGGETIGLERVFCKTDDYRQLVQAIVHRQPCCLAVPTHVTESGVRLLGYNVTRDSMIVWRRHNLSSAVTEIQVVNELLALLIRMR